MKALIIVAHGSKLESSNDEIIKLSKKVQEKSSSSLIIKAAFLELASPSISLCISEVLNDKNIKTIDVFPYFLAAGKHVKFDIPNEIKVLKNKYPNIQINLLPHLGNSEGLVNLILNN